MKPMDIEKKSFEIITEILGDKQLNPEHELIIKRVIHTTADFDYVDNLYFSNGVVKIIKNAILNGTPIVTDTNMARAGINKKKLKQFGSELHCFIADSDIVEIANKNGCTRAVASMEKAASIGPAIFALGNAPTALMRLCEMKEQKLIYPVAIIGVPVGFVNVVEAKELLIKSQIPCIAAKGRKGGSNVAASIVNAILYNMLK